MDTKFYDILERGTSLFEGCMQVFKGKPELERENLFGASPCLQRKYLLGRIQR